MTRKTRRTDPGSPTENGNVESEDGFKWLGSGVKVNRQMHFGKCKVDGMEVSVGDNVEIKLDSNSAVAEIRELYETVGENPHRARIRWYYPFEDIPKKYKQLVEKPIEKELFKPEDGLFLGSEEVIDVETIINTVTVWEIGEDDIPPPGDYFVRNEDAFGDITTDIRI